MNNMEFKAVSVKLTDTCLSFVLKRLGCYESYEGLDGDLFFTLNKSKIIKIENLSLKDIKRGDILIFKRKKEYYEKVATFINEKGVAMITKRNLSYHFMLHEGEFVTDYGIKGISSYCIDFFEKENSDKDLYVLPYKELNFK